MLTRMYASSEISLLSNLNQNRDTQQSKGLRIYIIYVHTYICVYIYKLGEKRKRTTTFLSIWQTTNAGQPKIRL